jgi:NAD(P)H-hydrate repair Nnr-like enzyme with NAD(P)H-hydrate epimerase domain
MVVLLYRRLVEQYTFRQNEREILALDVSSGLDTLAHQQMASNYGNDRLHYLYG